MEGVNYLDKGKEMPYRKACGCNKKSKVQGKYAFHNKCRTRDIIYSATFDLNIMKYLGKISNTFDKRIWIEHVDGLKGLCNLSEMHQKYQ